MRRDYPQSEEGIKRHYRARPQWIAPIILATQKAEIWRITAQSQLQANSSQDPISEKKTHHKKELAD
jgi:hypothetical protein